MNDFESALTECGSILEAALVIDSMVDELLPGGAAISSGADELVADVIEAYQTAEPYEAWVLNCLVHVARWLGVWSRMASGDSEVESCARAEVLIRARFERFSAGLMEGELSPDPEVRSLVYRFVGMAGLATEALLYLKRELAIEDVPLARAVALEGFATAMFRAGEPSSEDIAFVIQQVGDDPVALTRVSNVPSNFVTEGSAVDHRRRIEAVLGFELVEKPDWRHFWQSEQL